MGALGALTLFNASFRELSNNVGKAQLVGGLLPPDRYRDRKSSLFLLNQFSRAQNTKSDWESQIPIGFGMKYEQARNYTGQVEACS